MTATAKLFFIVILSLFGGQTTAGTVICSGTVTELSFHQPGLVFLRLNSMNLGVIVCNLNADLVVPGGNYTTTPTTCKTMYAAFLAAKLSGATINQVYFDGDAVPATCSGFANWTYATIRHYALY